jgi:hypothetical protein
MPRARVLHGITHAHILIHQATMLLVLTFIGALPLFTIVVAKLDFAVCGP